MKSIKLLLLICVAVTFSQCKSMKLTEKAPFNVTGATYHDWVGGQPGVSGTNLIIGIKNSENITFTSIYFRNARKKVSFETRNNKKYLVVNLKKSTNRKLGYTKQVISGSGNINNSINTTSTVKNIRHNNKKTPIPFKLKNNEAVICYKIKNKFYYYKVSEIKKKETIFYP